VLTKEVAVNLCFNDIAVTHFREQYIVLLRVTSSVFQHFLFFGMHTHHWNKNSA